MQTEGPVAPGYSGNNKSGCVESDVAVVTRPSRMGNSEIRQCGQQMLMHDHATGERASSMGYTHRILSGRNVLTCALTRSCTQIRRFPGACGAGRAVLQDDRRGRLFCWDTALRCTGRKLTIDTPEFSDHGPMRCFKDRSDASKLQKNGKIGAAPAGSLMQQCFTC